MPPQAPDRELQRAPRDRHRWPRAFPVEAFDPATEPGTRDPPGREVGSRRRRPRRPLLVPGPNDPMSVATDRHADTRPPSGAPDPDIAPGNFAIVTVYHFLFVPITIGLSAIIAGDQITWLRTINEGVAAADEVLF